MPVLAPPSATRASSSAATQNIVVDPRLIQRERIVSVESLLAIHLVWDHFGTYPTRLLEDFAALRNRIVHELSFDVALTLQIESAINSILQMTVAIPNRGELRDYLLRYPDVIQVLPSVCRIALEEFGEGSKLSLESYRDMEVRDEYMTLYVRQKEYDEGIMTSIRRVVSNYSDLLLGKEGWIVLTTDFAPPA